MRQHQFELLAPGGDIESIKAAIVAGADAIYCGLDNFNARNRAKNLSFDELNGVVNLAHGHQCQVFLTLNIMILEHEFSVLMRLLNKLVNTNIDALIVQDLGLFYLLSQYFPSIAVHASTQVTTHNEGQIEFLSMLNVSRVNLSRELSIAEIKALTAKGHEHHILSEVFVHGSYCIGFSGLCYISSAHGGNSGNRGRCSQPCREQYAPTAEGKSFPLNLKDNSAFFDLEMLADAGVDSLKIEGRIKDFHYVYTVVASWRQHLMLYNNRQTLADDNSALYKVFNRDLSNGYLRAQLGKDMFIDNPRNHALSHFASAKMCKTSVDIQAVKQVLYDEKILDMQFIRQLIQGLSIEKTALSLSVTGQLAQALEVSLTIDGENLSFKSESKLFNADKSVINKVVLEKRLKNLSSPNFYIKELDLQGLDSNLCLPFKELSSIKNQLQFALNGEKLAIASVALPELNKVQSQLAKPSLSVLIDSKRDLVLCQNPLLECYFKLPDSLGKQAERLIQMFRDNDGLLPWFPSVLIGDDFTAAVRLLNDLQPKRIVTNNTGIAFQAYQGGIEWIAGPQLNIANSYSLQALQERFNCSASFISNELNKAQMQAIKRPERFDLFYSLYHPMLLLSSRQCLFHQTVGCNKALMDEDCLAKCKKTAEIINLKGASFSIDKQVGRHTCLYNDEDFLNLDIISDLPDLFAGFFIDLSRVKTTTRLELNHLDVVARFVDLLAGKPDAKEQVQNMLKATTNQQYRKGL